MAGIQPDAHAYPCPWSSAHFGASPRGPHLLHIQHTDDQVYEQSPAQTHGPLAAWTSGGEAVYEVELAILSSRGAVYKSTAAVQVDCSIQLIEHAASHITQYHSAHLSFIYTRISHLHTILSILLYDTAHLYPHVGLATPCPKHPFMPGPTWACRYRTTSSKLCT